MSKKKKFQGTNPELENEILAIFKAKQTALFNHKQLAARINYQGDRNDIIAALNNLVKAEKIGEIERGKYHYIQQMSQVEGRMDITARGSGFLVTDEEGEEDIYIAPGDLNGAFHGDKVLVHLYARRRNKRLEGEVVEILQRARTQFVGMLERQKDFSFVIPDDRRMYTDIFIPNENLNSAKDGDKVVVTITDWPKKAKNPFGKITLILGQPGENNAEMHAIVAEFGFPLQFPENVLAEAEAIPTEVSKEEIAKRKDLREVLTFTIDPADAKDFDDALSYRKKKNGHVEVGIHIADVSHYVRPGTALDADAYDRGTSVYLVDRTIPMLPEKLSNGVCSLRPQEEKLTFSAIFELDETGKVYKEWFGKTVIFSDRRFAYEEAQEIIENGKGEYSEELKTLNDIAKNLREARFKNGAISFESEEVKFRLDEEGRPIELYKKIRKDAHKLIEEFMLLANRKVAEFCTPKKSGEGVPKDGKSDKPFVYRVHDAPNQEKLLEFSQFAKRFGYKIKFDSDDQIAHSFNDLLEEVEGKPEQNILQSMAIRTMAKAFYTTKKSGHYGLAFEHYSHFTSPIRRYPDLMAHRLLEIYLNNQKLPKGMDRDTLEKQCKHASEMESKAAEAERASVKYKQAEYLKQFVGRVFDGIISGVTDWGIYVELIENKCEGMIRLNSLFDDFYEFDEKQRAVIGKRYKKRYMIGDSIQVIVKKTDPIKRTIDFNIVANAKRFRD
ncbi:MAG: ribonuclease R [Bacteroidetes bacterium]|nr:ribonuclease R [Bacteroidota bacterium]